MTSNNNYPSNMLSLMQYNNNLNIPILNNIKKINTSYQQAYGGEYKSPKKNNNHHNCLENLRYSDTTSINSSFQNYSYNLVDDSYQKNKKLNYGLDLLIQIKEKEKLKHLQEERKKLEEFRKQERLIAERKLNEQKIAEEENRKRAELERIKCANDDTRNRKDINENNNDVRIKFKEYKTNQSKDLNLAGELQDHEIESFIESKKLIKEEKKKLVEDRKRIEEQKKILEENIRKEEERRMKEKIIQLNKENILNMLEKKKKQENDIFNKSMERDLRLIKNKLFEQQNDFIKSINLIKSQFLNDQLQKYEISQSLQELKIELQKKRNQDTTLKDFLYSSLVDANLKIDELNRKVGLDEIYVNKSLNFVDLKNIYSNKTKINLNEKIENMNKYYSEDKMKLHDVMRNNERKLEMLNTKFPSSK